MPQGFTRCAPNATYTLPFSIIVSETVLHPRRRNRSSSSSPRLRIDYSTSDTQTMPVPFRVMKLPTLKSVKLLCHRVLRGAPLAPRTRYRPPSPSPEPSSIPVHRNRSTSSFSALFTSTVLHPRLPSEPYRDAFAASDADVNETGGVGRELIAVKIPCNASCRHLQNH